jgi:hypothetical protein
MRLCCRQSNRPPVGTSPIACQHQTRLGCPIAAATTAYHTKVTCPRGQAIVGAMLAMLPATRQGNCLMTVALNGAANRSPSGA